MVETTERVVLRTQPPVRWPEVPELMSFSMLMDIEDCPHRWALSAASYDHVWSGRGYPRPLHISSLTGVVVHAALETIVSALSRSGCNSLASSEAVAAMKELGGYSVVLEQAIEGQLGLHRKNPRARHVLEYFSRTLKAKIAEMRTQVQTLLLRVSIVPTRSASNSSSHQDSLVPKRRMLTPGTYTEITVVASTIGWKARLDLLSLTTEQCVITEYKTGAANDSHSFQVKVYALLWYRDSVLNPSGRLANRLVLSYGSGDVSVVAPDVNELAILEKTIIERTATAKVAVAQSPPTPSPSCDRCLYCYVRHLCVIYWSDSVQKQLALSVDHARSFGDIEIVIQRAHGTSSWVAYVHAGLPPLLGISVLLRSRVEGLMLIPDTRLRLLDVHIRLPDAFEEIATITIGTLSEVFQCGE
jgi:hypothetical protein